MTPIHKEDEEFKIGLARSDGKMIIGCGTVDPRRNVWKKMMDITDEAISAVRDLMISQYQSAGDPEKDEHTVEYGWSNAADGTYVSLELHIVPLEKRAEN